MPQPPTCTQMRIRTVRDAQRILFACFRGDLPMITSRLDSTDRTALVSGNVYAWEERGSRSEPGVGIERFTEGKRWTPSRLREDFLYYYEKYLHLSENDQKLLPPPNTWDPYIKQTYSAWVTTPKGDRKWHLTAYYTEATRTHLRTIDDVPLLRDLVVPENHFRTNADVKSKRPDDTKAPISRTFAPFRSPWSSSSPLPETHIDYEPPTQSSSMGFFDASNTHRFSRAADNSHTIPVEAIYPYPPGYSYQATHVALSPPENTVHNVSTNGPGLYHCPTTVESLPVPSKPIMFSQDVEDSPPAPTVLVTPQFTEKCDKRNSRHSNSKVDLAPLHVVLRHHPYRRDPLDDKALRMLGSRA